MIIDADNRAAKLQRVRSGEKPRVLELCSGCGGLSLGFAAAGFNLQAHVECDPIAAKSYALNFEPPEGVSSDKWSAPRDMVEQTADDVVDDLGLATPAAASFDVLAAGLPCQAFARIGRSKLRSLKGDVDAFRNDPRARLYKRFLQYVEAVQPVAIVIENVPDILNFGGHNVPEEICATLEEAGYNTGYTLLNAAFYGVPQIRERLFLIALDQSLGIRPSFPEPTCKAELPSGYEGARTVALKHVPSEGSRFTPIPQASAMAAGAVSTKEAIADLPYISEHFRDPAAMRRRKVGDELAYRSYVDLSEYARRMREWPGFEAGESVTGNVVRLTPRDFPIFRRMPAGADYPQALKIAEEIFAERLLLELSPPPHGSKPWDDLRGQCVPPYDGGKFPNKWWKLDPALPSRTLTAHIGKDTYSHIHWDSKQQRTISVREAARLQSFPDGFQFAGAMNAAFRQIGNAVPPLLAMAVAERLRNDLMATRTEKGVGPTPPDSMAA
ncbi:DNA cytosine methyltransferase [Chelativorans sp. M5D2P16]|uniref:DNA cytosine methyltransferase n=1 Tax=Chelativorans sp. M5D2P16 TaxID=3095678 RepID=UPI002ACAC722|nr:DNA cytosine methyltransferase [Chelativorans sp. M5D2P16]MDZ5698645.1 DNA cytosine methyltransferase [Chelativorans sp. M5D2P16]